VDFLTAAGVWGERVLNTSNSGVRELVQAYTATEGFWQTDRHQRLVEQGSAECAEADEVSGLIALCRQRYSEVVSAAHTIFLRAVEREGWPPEGIQRQTETYGKYVAPALEERRKVAFFLVDAMRYEMGRDLGATLDAFGAVTVAAAATVLPTSTTCGMAALMPGADGAFALVNDGKDGIDISPAIGGRILRNSAERMRLLRELKGDLFRDFPLGDLSSMPQKKLQGAVGNADLVVVRSQEIDSLGEGPSLYMARKLMSDIIGDVRTVTDRLIGVKVWFNSLLTDSLTARIDAYDGPGAKAKIVGEAADCEARDPGTRLVTLPKSAETQVPIRISDKFDGASVEIRATDPATGTIFARLKLKNSIME
jgi:hypothetical protein